MLSLPDVAHHITVYLTNEELKRLYLLGLISSLSQLANSEIWWYDRVCILSSLSLPIGSGDSWKQTYQLLLCARLGRTDFYNAEDNATVMEIMWRLGCEPGVDDIRRAAGAGHLRSLRWLLDNGAAHPNCFYPIIEAAMGGQAEAVQMLLSEARANAAESYGRTNALVAACRVTNPDRILSYIEIVRLLLLDGRIDPARWQSEALHVDTNYDGSEIIDLLLSDGRANPRSQNQKVLIDAIEEGRVCVVARLLQDERVDVYANPRWALALVGLTLCCESRAEIRVMLERHTASW